MSESEPSDEFDRHWLRLRFEDLAQQEAEAKREAAQGRGRGDDDDVEGGAGGEEAVENPLEAVPFEDDPGWAAVFGKKP